MVDRATFRRLNPNYVLPTPVPPKVEDNAHIKTNNRFGQQHQQVDPYGNPIPMPIVPVQNLGTHFLPSYPSSSTINLPRLRIDHLVQTQSNDATSDVEMTDAELLLAPTVVFGFSLVDKVWCEQYDFLLDYSLFLILSSSGV